MRNILIILTLCFVYLTSPLSVRAEIFDESKRTERLGLSYYDGRPMYFLSVARPLDRPHYPLYLEATRVHTGEDISDYPNYQKGTGYVIIEGATSKDFVIYGYDKDGNLEYLSGAGDPDNSGWMQEALRLYGPGAIAEASLTGGDVAVDIFDALLKPLREWLGGALGFWLAICVVFLGWQYLRRLARGGVAIGGKSAEVEASNDDFLEGFRRRRAEKLAAKQEREKLESFQKAWGAIRELGEADAYATGEAFGLTFTDKVVKSNLILQEAWSRLSEDERRFLANEARALAWQDDLIGEKEKIYRQAVMETALGDLDGVDASSVFSNPFEDATYYDDDNGGTPF